MQDYLLPLLLITPFIAAGAIAIQASQSLWSLMSVALGAIVGAICITLSGICWLQVLHRRWSVSGDGHLTNAELERKKLSVELQWLFPCGYLNRYAASSYIQTAFEVALVFYITDLNILCDRSQQRRLASSYLEG